MTSGIVVARRINQSHVQFLRLGLNGHNVLSDYFQAVLEHVFIIRLWVVVRLGHFSLGQVGLRFVVVVLVRYVEYFRLVRLGRARSVVKNWRFAL